MKTSRFYLLIFIISGVFFTSCDTIYFSAPQPINSKNIYEFPKEYRGMWIDDGDTITIGKDYFIYKDYKQTHSIALNEIDTAVYILKHNKIYVFDKYADIGLSEGYSYILKNDSIHFKACEINSISLGKNNFLRKVKHHYVLNTTNNFTWWYLYLIQKQDDSLLKVHILDENDLELTSNYQLIFNDKSEIYLNASWNTDQINTLIKNGGFSDEILQLNLNNKIPLKK